MGSIYARYNKLWARYKDESGKWVSVRTPYSVGEEDKARRYVARLEARAESVADFAPAQGGPLTVARYAERWLADRAALQLASHADDVSRMRKHVLPRIGSMRLDEVRPRHIRDLVLELRKLGKTSVSSPSEPRENQGPTTSTPGTPEAAPPARPLAPRTIRNVYGLLVTMFKNAVADELILATPCVLMRNDLPKKVDKDPSWRATAIYTREEVEQLISDPRVPEDRRVLYALKALSGLRHSEAAELTWRQYNRDRQPLGALSIERTKTRVPRLVPVHPTLARILAEWRLAGWERVFGRQPRPDDLVTPTRNMTPRTAQEAPKQLHLDLETLGLRKRRGHDLRRTFITLARVDGARTDLLEVITHAPSAADMMDVYTTFPWEALCEEVRKLRIEGSFGRLLIGDFATGLATAELKSRNRWRKGVTPSGIEPEIAP